MQAAALFFLASSMGVVFGWQPMPDGSPRYEYVVQLDPDLVATLEAGQSIPISTDIPDDIQPIGRIRIVVGREPLPRTRLTATLNPVEKKSRAGLLETQYRVAPVEPTAAGRYGNTNTSPQAILPSRTPPPVNNQQFAQSQSFGTQPVSNPAPILPNQDTQGLAGSLQEATQSLGNQFRNLGESVRTDAQQMFGRPGNNAISGALGQVGDSLNRVQQGLQQGVEPLRQVVEQTGQQLRGTVADIGQQTRAAVDQFGRPLRKPSIPGHRENNQQAILPSGSPIPPQNFAGSQSNPRGQRLDQPVSPQRDNWQAPPWDNPTTNTPGNISPGNAPPLTQATTTNPGGFNSPWPSQLKNESRDDYRNQASQQSSQPPSWPNKTPNDRFDIANRTITNQQPANGDANSHRLQGATAPSRLPAFSAPEVRRDMLNQPADAELVAADGQAALPSSNPSFSQSPASQSPASQSPDRQPQATSFDWENARRNSIDTPSAPDKAPPRTVFPLVLSWVLLSGSGAGNLYLLWSFWDVRNKYRGLVHNARNSGGRH